LQERSSFLGRPIAALQKFAEQAQGLTQGGELKAVPVAVQGSGLSDRLLSGTRSFASGLLETVLVLFFLAGQRRHFPEAARRNPAAVQEQAAGGRHLPADRERCVVLHVYDHDHERGRGVAIGAVMAFCGVGDPILWGTVAVEGEMVTPTVSSMA
jgi:hypothetical protein